MPLQATSGAASYDAFGGGVPFEPTYIESCFATHLYTGNNSTQVINNGIDLAGKGGLVWLKRRNAATSHVLSDSARGLGSSVYRQLFTDLTSAQNSTTTEGISSFGSGGFTLTTGSDVNALDNPYVSWTFREQPKFFDVVTFTENTAGTQTISHSLGSTPGCIIFKTTSRASDWYVYHRSLGTTKLLNLNSTSAEQNTTGIAAVSDTTFGVAMNNIGWGIGTQWVAYVFAHNAGGFGLTGTDNVISCGSYTGTGAVGNTVTLGYEPQWLLVKKTNDVSDWVIVDNMRNFSLTSNRQLFPNSSAAEDTAFFFSPTATGFTLQTTSTFANGSGSTYIYIAIRRGPMRTPTSGTSVFSPIARTGDGTGGNPSAVTTGIVTDMAMVANRTSNVAKFNTVVRLTNNQFLRTVGTNAQTGSLPAFPTNTFDLQNGFFVGNDSDSATLTNGNGSTYINYAFRRAPGFMDVCCYTGTGANANISHNLGAVPELMIVKQRSNSNPWNVYAASLGNNTLLVLNTTAASSSAVGRWDFTTPTSAVFTVGSNGEVNGSGNTYVAYLFASCPGVSKVGSYTGNGTAGNAITTGFAPRFLMIKCTTTAGGWIVFDSARGMAPGNDPSLYLNSTAAEITGTDWLDVSSTGFSLNTTGNTTNGAGETYIYLAIA